VDFAQPIRGRTVDGIWVPDSAFDQKSDRTQSGMTTGDYSGVLQGASAAESKFKDYQSYLEAIKTVPWVFACVSLLAYTFAIAPGDLIDLDNDDQPIEDPHDPFLQLWHRPNPHQSGFVFKELLAMFVELAGEAYISLEAMDAAGRPSELYLPSPARMRIVQDKKTGDVIGYAYDTSGYQNGRYLPSFIPYSVDEIVHIKVANPLNILRGLGNIEAMEVTMDTMIAMTRNELSYWQSGGRITGVLETDQEVDNETFDRLVNRWRQFTADKRQRFKTAILEQGLKYTPVAEGFKGLDYSKLDVAKRDFVLANFGVPKNKLGIIEDAAYKSDEADRFFMSETMEPRLTRFEDAIQPLVDIFGANRAWKFERKNFEDDTVKLNNAMVMNSLKSFTRDEIRVYLGVEPIGGKAGKIVILQQTDVPTAIDSLDEASAAGVAGGGPPPLKPPDDPSKIKPPTPPGVPPHSHAGTAPIPGVSTGANGNENGRTGAVDATGHLPNKPNVHNATEGAAAAASKAWTPETLAALTEDERDQLRFDMDRRVKAAQVVARNLKARGRTARATPLGRVVEYAEKSAVEASEKAAATRELPAPRPGHIIKPGTAELVSGAATRVREGLTSKWAPKLREAFSAQRRALTPVLTKILKISDSAERRAMMAEQFPRGKGPAEVISAIHAEAANVGWRTGKQSLGFQARTAADFEVKAAALGHEPLVSPFLSNRYERTIGTSIVGIDDTTQGAVMDLVDEGLRRGYSPLQIASGVPDEEFAGVNSVFDDAYRSEMIARTESMTAYNWGAGNSLLDSGATQEEAMDGSDDEVCAARNGETYDIDPETGFAIDDSGNEIVDHPNGTLAFIPTGDLSDLVDTGAVEELSQSEWETKSGTGQDNNPGGANQYGGIHQGAHGYEQNAGDPKNFQPDAKVKPGKGKGKAGTHSHGKITHAHAGATVGHTHGKGVPAHNWTNTGPGGTTVDLSAGKDAEDLEIIKAITSLTLELKGALELKYSADQSRDYHGRFGVGGAGAGMYQDAGRGADVASVHQVVLAAQRARDYSDAQTEHLEAKLLALQHQVIGGQTHEERAVALFHIGAIVAGTAIGIGLTIASAPFLLAATIAAAIPIGAELLALSVTERENQDFGSRETEWTLKGAADEQAVIGALTQGMVRGGLDSETASRAANGMVQLALNEARAQNVKPGLADISDDQIEGLLQSLESAAKSAGLKYSADQPRDYHGRFGEGGVGHFIKATTIPEAIALLGDGKGIMFERPDQAVTLLHELAKMANEAKAAGKDAKSYDLCRVSVSDTNLFCADNVGIPRNAMPQLTGVPIPGSFADSLPRDVRGNVDLSPAFRDSLTASGSLIIDTNEFASHLRASQDQLDGTKVAGIMGAMEAGTKIEGRIFISDDNYIVDGHHRWAAEVGLGLGDKKEMSMQVARVNMKILPLLAAANAFAEKMGIPQSGFGKDNEFAKVHKDADETEVKYSADQPRDDHGKFGTGAGETHFHGGLAHSHGARARTHAHSDKVAATVPTADSLHETGKKILTTRVASPTTGLDKNWDVVKQSAFVETQKSWGGQTIDSHTGEPISPKTGWAATGRDPGQSTTSIPENVTAQEFSLAMDSAKAAYGDQLARAGYALGVFHDDDKHVIEIDPTVVLNSTAEVDAVVAYNGATGGAYDFATGDGYWPGKP
jgi:HK97 family phage portal protein